MKSITVRGIEPEVARKLKQMAIDKHSSINQLILNAIHIDLGMEKEKKYTKTYDDLDDLFGKWSQAEFDHINKTINQNRAIDAELWV